MATPLRLPPIATDTTEGTLVRWLVAVGDPVEEGQVVAEIDTAKVLFEVEAPSAGTVLGLLVDEGRDVEVGDTLAWLGEPGEVIPDVPPQAPTDSVVTPWSSEEGRASEPTATGEIRAAPAVRRLAERLGVDLATIAGSGPGGRILKEDVESTATSVAAPPPPPPPPPSHRVNTVQEEGEAESGLPDRLRAAVAAATSRSWQEVPHFACDLEVDTSPWEEEIAAHGFTAVLLVCVARRLADDPLLNATYEEGRGRIEAGEVNIGVAVAVDGGLVVPVIHSADELDLATLNARVTELAAKAREHRLTSADAAGATFTVSNAGMSGIDAIVPIVHQPAVAILGVGKRVLRPVVEGGAVVARPTVRLVLSCDHRAVDGLEASRWLVGLGRELSGAR
jgi:pyruvate dehydrogenase E2 component (dihydrolipoamide acetyltransferase)